MRVIYFCYNTLIPNVPASLLEHVLGEMRALGRVEQVVDEYVGAERAHEEVGAFQVEFAGRHGGVEHQRRGKPVNGGQQPHEFGVVQGAFEQHCGEHLREHDVADRTGDSGID